MARSGLGVEVRESSIRIKFVYQGKTIKERLTVNGEAIQPTPANVKFAQRVAADIRKRIAQGNFDVAEFFPDSNLAKTSTPGVTTFQDLATQWLESKGQLEKATLSQYTRAVDIWKRLLGAQTPIDDLRYQVLASIVGKHPWASAKSANNYLIVLRGIMAHHYRGELAAKNPTIGIKNLKVVRKLPDPLTTEERDLILADMAKKYDRRIVAYFTFAFYTGMRPEEIIALRWSDIDQRAETIRVQRVRTFKGSERDGSKTHAERDVELVSAALDALSIMKPFTMMKRGKNGESPDIFENPVTGRSWHDERSQRDHYWTPTLKRLGIRHRRAYNTRHTFATAALMAGVNAAYIARQLGHTNAKMLLEKYARWIDGADKGSERKALEAALVRTDTRDILDAIVPNSSQ